MVVNCFLLLAIFALAAFLLLQEHGQDQLVANFMG
jgi:hypothetical protein